MDAAGTGSFFSSDSRRVGRRRPWSAWPLTWDMERKMAGTSDGDSKLQDVKNTIAQVTAERHGQQFHRAKNVAMALVAERRN